MSSLKVFRKNQRVLMVITTVLSMISFVFLGAMSKSGTGSHMPAVLLVLLMATIVGGSAWVLGLINNKSGEYGMFGAIAGAIIGLGVSWSNREPPMVVMKSGNMSAEQVRDLRSQRSIANNFVRAAYERVNGMDPLQIERFLGRRILFGFFGGDGGSTNDLVATELLLREADRIGVKVPESAVFEYIRGLSGNPAKALSQPQFDEIRARLRVSEDELLSALQTELKAREAAELMYPRLAVPPEGLWDFYRKLHVLEEADVAVLPVASFVDAEAKPSDQELGVLFDKYRETVPGVTSDGRYEEGRPGFFQPPRTKLAYLEAVFEDFEKKVPEITDEEIEKRYEEAYKKPLTVPSLPGDKESAAEGKAAPSTENPDSPPAPPTSEPAATETPTTPSTEKPAEEPSTIPAPPASPPESGSETPKAPEGEKAPETPAEPEKSSSMLLSPIGRLMFTAFADEPAATEAKLAEEKPAEEKPAAEPAKPEDKPAAPAEAASSTEKPADAPATAESKPDESKPADAAATPGSTIPTLPTPPTVTDPAKETDPPLPTVRPLDDELRAKIREELMQEKAFVLMDKAIQEAAGYMADEVGSGIFAPSDDAKRLSPEAAAEKLKAYAKEKGLVYVETPWMSLEELDKSEDYPIGSAMVVSGAQHTSVVRDLQSSFGANQKYLVHRAVGFADSDVPTAGQGRGNQYAYWMIDLKDSEVPEDMSDPIVREQVVKAWRNQQALKKAEARAEEIAKMVRESGDKPMGEVLGQQTVTGKAETAFLTVQPTGQFSWYQTASTAASPFDQRRPEPRLSDLPGLAPVGEQFMTKVFDGLKVGETGVASSAEKTEVFVVKVVSRNPSNAEGVEDLRKEFLAGGQVPEYQSLEQREMAFYGRDGLADLWRREDVEIMESTKNQNEE
jgi:hypothetical protein